METSLTVIDREACDVGLVGVGGASSSMLCATGWGKTSVCTGDGGGPLIIKGAQASDDILVGIVSFISKDGCATGRPDVFGRISAGIAWIKTTIAK